MANKSKLTEEDLLLLTGLRTMLAHLVSLDGENGILPNIYKKAWPEPEESEEQDESDHERFKFDELLGTLQEAQEALAYLIPSESKD